MAKVEFDGFDILNLFYDLDGRFWRVPTDARSSHLDGQSSDFFVDLRDNVNAPDTSLTGPRPVGQDGAVAFVVEDDVPEGTAAILVLIDAGGTVMDKTAVTVGA